MNKNIASFLILAVAAAAVWPLIGGETPSPRPVAAPPTRGAVEVNPANNQGLAPAKAPRQQPGRSQTAVRPVADSRPAPVPRREPQSSGRMATGGRPAPAPQREPEVIRGVQRPANGVVASPRPLPAAPLPPAIRLDRRCTPYEFVTLRPYTIAPRGNKVELVDGSLWHVAKKKERRKVRNWSLWDHIIIESSQLFGWTTFTLVNYTRGESVEVTLTRGSTYEGRASHWITRLDPTQRVAVLEDGSRWSFLEASFGDWRENDAVVLGLARDESGHYVYMLINTRTQKHSLAINVR